MGMNEPNQQGVMLDCVLRFDLTWLTMPWDHRTLTAVVSGVLLLIMFVWIWGLHHI